MCPIMQSSCHALAQVVTSFELDRLTPETLGRARLLVLDNIGCAVAASTTEWGRAIVASGLADRTQAAAGASATAYGDVNVWSPRDAAPINAQLANCLDFDDTAHGHPGAVVVSTAIALGEACRASGAEVLAAVAVGYEIAGRLSEATTPTWNRRRELWGTGCRYSPAAAAVASRLLGLNEERAAHAIAIAACNGPLPAVGWTVYGSGGPSTTKNGYGAAVAAGIAAAYEAKCGMTGPVDVLETKRYAYMLGSDHWNPDGLLGGPGPQLDRVVTKPYPCCRKIHSSIDAALTIQREHAPPVEEITRIIAAAPAWQGQICFGNPRPSTMAAAQFSAAHCIAAALAGYSPGPAWFSQEVLDDPLVGRLAGRVQVVTDDTPVGQAAPWHSSVRIETEQHGWTTEVVDPRGDPETPMTHAELEEKFLSLATPVIGEQGAVQVVTTVTQLERLDGLAELTEKLRIASGAADAAVTDHQSM